MSKAKGDERINIRPEVSILSVLRHLNYKPWYAMAEFVDNSLQSFLSSRPAIESLHRNEAKLKVEIELDATPPGRIVVRDNAAGIGQSDYPRAFKPAEPPADKTGLSEFGMGMKSAACWLALDWSVRTTAIHETIERTVAFDVTDIVQNRIEELDIRTRQVPASDHYTELVLEGLHKSTRPADHVLDKVSTFGGSPDLLEVRHVQTSPCIAPLTRRHPPRLGREARPLCCLGRLCGRLLPL